MAAALHRLIPWALILSALGCDEAPSESVARGLVITPLSLASTDGTRVERAVFSATIDGEPFSGTGYVRIEIVERANPSSVICRAARRSARREATDENNGVFVVEGALFVEPCPEADTADSRSARFTFNAQAGAEGARGAEVVGTLDALPPSLSAPP